MEILLKDKNGAVLKTAKKYCKEDISVKVDAKDLKITPSTEEQTQDGLFGSVTVDAVQTEDLSITPKETTQTFNGIYENVNVDAIQTEEVTITTDFSSKDTIEVTPTGGKYIKKATINKDANLTPENIKTGVTIFGIEGNLADTHDADATADDIVLGKTAYVANEMVVGAYEPLDTSDATATAGDIAKDKTAYVNGEKITGTLEAMGDYNATMTGDLVSGTSTCTNIFKLVREIPTNITVSGTSLAYAFNGCSNLQTIPEIDTSSITDMKYMFQNCTKLTTIPQLDTSSVKDMQYMFGSCTALTTIPQLDTSSVTTMYRMFTSCSKLTNTCLNTILQMCINTTAYTSTKTLKAIGLSSTLAARCQSLSNFQAFLDAGWTTGY